MNTQRILFVAVVLLALSHFAACSPVERETTNENDASGTHPYQVNGSSVRLVDYPPLIAILL